MSDWTSDDILEIAVEALEDQKRAGETVYVSIAAEQFYLLGCAIRTLEEQAAETTKILGDISTDERYS